MVKSHTEILDRKLQYKNLSKLTKLLDRE